MCGSLLELQAQEMDLRQMLGLNNLKKEAFCAEEVDKRSLHAMLELQNY